jgi:hypothetical protein
LHVFNTLRINSFNTLQKAQAEGAHWFLTVCTTASVV